MLWDYRASKKEKKKKNGIIAVGFAYGELFLLGGIVAIQPNQPLVFSSDLDERVVISPMPDFRVD